MTPDPERIAVLADIHGNRWALEAVLADAEKAGATAYLDAGDTVYGPLDPQGTVACLQALTLPFIRVNGNGDRMLWDGSPRTPTMDYILSCLNNTQIDWLRAAPAVLTWREIFLFHGQPGNDTAYLCEYVDGSGAHDRPRAEIERLLGPQDGRIAVCGHSHLPRLMSLANGGLLLNPGSVGLPAYEDDTPCPHVMETGSPHARYALIERGPAGPLVRLVSVPYDWERAARRAERQGRQDWARGLRSGRM